MATERIKVYFRKFPDGDVIAIWDDDSTANTKWCVSYQHIGQHSLCHRELISELKKPKATELAALLLEMQNRGYDVTIKG